MTNNKAIIMLFALSTILITGGLTMAPAAYSTGNNHDDSHDDSHGGCHDDSHDDSHGDSNGDCIPDPCDCKRPDTFKVRYDGPGTSDNPVTVEIYKKTSKLDKGPKLTIEDVFVGDPLILEEEDANQIVVSKSNFNKDKLSSNIGYRILFDIVGDVDDNGVEIDGAVEIALIDIHVSCSDQIQMLYIGQVFTYEFTYEDGTGTVTDTVTLTIEDGTKGQGVDEYTSIPISNPLTCEAPPEPVKKASMTLKKTLTTDNGGEALPSNFEATLTEVGADLTLGGTDDTSYVVSFKDIPDTSMGEIVFEDALGSGEIPVGKYVLSELFIPAAESTETQADYTTVLVAGDTSCPSMEGEIFDLNENDKIICTIYNDDNGTISGGDGVTFGLTSLSFIVDSTGDPVDPTDATTAGINSCHIPGAEPPCVANLNESFQPAPPAGADKVQWLIVDEAVTESSIFVFTMIPPFDPDALVPFDDDGDLTIDLQVHTCITAGVVFSPVLQPDEENPTLKAFRMNCNVINPGDWIINYGFIETTMLG